MPFPSPVSTSTCSSGAGPGLARHKMADRDAAQAQAQDEAFRSYVQESAQGNGAADELTKLAGLRDHGAITEAEFQQGKNKILTPAA